MLYSAFISRLRAQCGDIKRAIHVDWTGDGATTVFQMPTDTFPVYDDSTTYTVKVAGVAKTETTHYVLDKLTGTLTMVSTPTNGQAVTIDCQAAHLRDEDWLNIINDVIRSLGDDFWKEFVDTTNFTATSGMLSLSLVASQVNCIAVYEFARRLNTESQWQNVEDRVNWRYDRDNNIIYIGRSDAFSVTGELLRIRGLKTFTIGTAVTDTIDVQDKFLTILEYGSLARYWAYRYKDVVELVTKITQESSRTPLQELMMLNDRFERKYENEKAKLKPMKPPKIIPARLNNGGAP